MQKSRFYTLVAVIITTLALLSACHLPLTPPIPPDPTPTATIQPPKLDVTLDIYWSGENQTLHVAIAVSAPAGSAPRPVAFTVLRSDNFPIMDSIVDGSKDLMAGGVVQQVLMICVDGQPFQLSHYGEYHLAFEINQ